jgi:transcription termination factor Rho
MSENKLYLSELKAQSPADLLAQAEALEIEAASSMRKGDMMFAILKERVPRMAGRFPATGCWR